MTTQQIKLIPSISMKTLGYSAKELRKVVEGKDSAQFIARIGGIAAAHFVGEGKNGEWVGFKGDFTAATKDGEIYESKTIFFPTAIANKLQDRLQNGEVEIEVFADIFAVETDKNASGYAYMCEPVLTESADRRKQEINKRLLSAKLPVTLALAAPSQEVTKKKA